MFFFFPSGGGCAAAPRNHLGESRGWGGREGGEKRDGGHKNGVLGVRGAMRPFTIPYISPCCTTKQGCTGWKLSCSAHGGEIGGMRAQNDPTGHRERFPEQGAPSCHPFHLAERSVSPREAPRGDNSCSTRAKRCRAEPLPAGTASRKTSGLRGGLGASWGGGGASAESRLGGSRRAQQHAAGRVLAAGKNCEVLRNGFCPFWAKRPFCGSFEAGGLHIFATKGGDELRTARKPGNRRAAQRGAAFQERITALRGGDSAASSSPQRNPHRAAARNACSAQRHQQPLISKGGGCQVTKPPLSPHPQTGRS